MHARPTALLAFVLTLGFGHTAQAALVANPPMVLFPPTNVGAQSPAVNVVITNAGPGPATISGSIFGNAADFILEWGVLQPPFAIGKGGSFTVTIKFAPQAMGPRSATFMPAGMQLAVPLFGGHTMLFASPPTIDFGSVLAPANSKPQTVTFINPTNAVISITNIQFQGPHANWFRLGGMQVPPVKIPANGSVGMDLTATPLGLGAGTASAVFTTDDVMVPTITVLLKVTGVVADVTVNPAAGTFGPMVVGGERLIHFTVTNTGNNTVALKNFLFLDPKVCACFTVHNAPLPDNNGDLPSLRAGDTLKFSVTFTPPAEGMYSASIEIDTDSATAPHIQVPLTGQGVAAILQAAPTHLDFDGVAVGTTSAPGEITITNILQAEVTISTTSLSGAGAGHFRADLLSRVALAPGQSNRIRVICAPLSPGMFSASLVITPMGFAPVQVPLTCNAVVRPQAIEMSTAIADFEPVLVGQDSAPQAIGIKVPEGAADFVLDRITSSNAAFRIDRTSTMLALRAGDATTFRMIFHPTEAGPAMATISVFGKGELMALGTLQARGSGAVSPDADGSDSGCAISGRAAPRSALVLLIVVGGVAVVSRRRRRG